MSNITAESTIKHLKQIFSRLTAPKSITSDNGPQFNNSDYRKFCETNGIIPYYTPSYWPAGNGLVERQNESIKKRLQISEFEGTNWKDDLIKYIVMYNTTPQSTTTPTQLLMNRTIRDKIPTLTNKSNVTITEAMDKDITCKAAGKTKEDQK